MGISEDDLLDRLRQGYEAFNRGDYDAAAEWVHPDMVFVSAGAIISAGAITDLRERRR